MLTPHRRRNPFLIPFFLAAAGIGACGWYGLAWYELPHYSEADIEASTTGNLAVDLARRGSQLQPDAESLDRLRAQVRAEIEADIRKEREEVQQGFAVGLMCLVLAAGHALFMWLLLRDPAKPKP